MNFEIPESLKQYLATLETMLNAAARDAKLDEAVAVRAELGPRRRRCHSRR